jgi:hypothetical protein
MPLQAVAASGVEGRVEIDPAYAVDCREGCPEAAGKLLVGLLRPTHRMYQREALVRITDG